ncbi:hypothetical protein [Vibrio metschnikovii]|uniref:hypothetical protein n=1 Tax=Vibrio metschnikovii TaxID=28172 RepID=UPI002FC9615B
MLKGLAEKGINLEARLTDFNEDLNNGLTEDEARGVKQFEVDGWIEASIEALSADFGAKSEQAKEFENALGKMRENLDARPVKNPRTYMNSFIWSFRDLVKTISKYSYLTPKSTAEEVRGMVNNVTINLGEGASFTGPVSAGENIRVSYKEASKTKEDDMRMALEELVEKVSALTEAVDSEKSKTDISAQLEGFVLEAKKESPSSWMMNVTSQGLLEAAKTVASLTEPVTKAVQAVLRLVI